MQQGRNAAKSAGIWPKQPVARKLARNSRDFKKSHRNRGDRQPQAGFQPIENCVPSAI
jgi:hypothetical protein